MTNEFSWEKYQAGAKVQRRDGLELLNVYRNTVNCYEPIAQVYRGKDGRIYVCWNRENGKYYDSDSDHDLILAPNIQEFWIPISKKSHYYASNECYVHNAGYAYFSEKEIPNHTDEPYIVKVRINLDTGEQVL